MPKCRPSKWIMPWALLGVGLPLIGGWLLSSNGLQNDVAGTAKSVLDASDITKWASIDVDGRDVTIKGESLSQAAIDEAVKAVAAAPGVRRVNSAGATLAALAAPTIDSISTSNAQPEIKGTWPEGVATALAVTVAGATYTLGKSPELTSSAGVWTLKPSAPIAEGNYDATVEVSDGTRTAPAAAPAKVLVDLTPPVIPVPTIPKMQWPYAISGTWAEEPGATLQAETNGKTYVLGKDAALTSDGAGNYSFAPTDISAPGTYDIKFTSNDAVGNVGTVMVPAAIVIPQPGETPVVAETPAKELARPTVEKQLALSGAPIIKGTWPHDMANMLKVSVAGRGYELGKDANLSAKDGNWTLFPAASLKDGYYDVVVAASDASGQISRDSTVAELEVDGDPPAAPTVTASTVIAGATTIAGTWDEKQAKALTVAVPDANVTATLGAEGSPLTSDGGGNWSLALATPLAAGKYDVQVTTTDVHGRTQTDVSATEIVVEAPVPASLEIEACAADAPFPRDIKGRWSEGTAKSLKAKLAGRTYELGKGMALTSDGSGAFTFSPRAAGLQPGTYTIWFTSKGQAGDVAVAKCDVSIPAPSAPMEAAPEPAPEPAKFVPPTPPTPQIGLYAGPCAADAPWPREIKGRWSEGTALNLKAKLGGRTYELGKGMALTSDGRGVFTFAPRAMGLKPGSNTIWFTSKGPGGDVRVAKCDITVPAPAAAPEPMPAVVETPQITIPTRPFDCVATLQRLNQVFPIRFEFDRDELQGISGLSVAQYGALLKDARCADLKVELGGHADFRGSERYNQGLSERRAQRVLGALKDAGIDTSRLSPKGYSELIPNDPATTDEAREKNRRVEVTVAKN